MPNVFPARAVGSARPMLIDRYLPDYDVTARRHVVVDADPETTYAAMLAADLQDTGPVVRALGALRLLPEALARRLRGEPPAPAPEHVRFADVAAAGEWTKLDEAPGEEFLLGAVGRFWQPTIEWRRVAPRDFAAFDEPGYAKLAVSLSVRPHGDRRTLLSYEARTATTDERARRNFRRYWRVVGPFAGYLMARALDRARADAEDEARRRRERESTRRPGRTARRAVVAGVALAGGYYLLTRVGRRRRETPDADATDDATATP